MGIGRQIKIEGENVNSSEGQRRMVMSSRLGTVGDVAGDGPKRMCVIRAEHNEGSEV